MERSCRDCGCTDDDCTVCYLETGRPCYWVEIDLCSRCHAEEKQKLVARKKEVA